MTMLAVSVAGILMAAAAAAYPYLSSAKPSGLTPSSRADWVNRLFSLAAQADGEGRQDVATAARALVAALVAQKDASKR